MSKRDRLRLKRRIREDKARRGNCCKRCKSKYKLEYAHLIPTRLSGHSGRGSWSRYNDIIQNPECYILLCHKCHVEYDNSGDYIQIKGLCGNSAHQLPYRPSLCHTSKTHLKPSSTIQRKPIDGNNRAFKV